MEANNRDGVFECLWRPLRRVWRFLFCLGPEDTEPNFPVQETTPVFESSVRPW